MPINKKSLNEIYTQESLVKKIEGMGTIEKVYRYVGGRIAYRAFNLKVAAIAMKRYGINATSSQIQSVMNEETKKLEDKYKKEASNKLVKTTKTNLKIQ